MQIKMFALSLQYQTITNKSNQKKNIMCTVTIKKTESGKYSIDCPYNKKFVARIKELGGMWKPFVDGSRKWVVEPEALELAKDCLRDIYGTDGTDQVESVRFQAKINTEVRGDFELFDRTIIRVLGRDSGVRPSEGVLIVSGRAKSGGSMKNPKTILDECIIEFSMPANYIEREDVKEAISEGWLRVVESHKRTREDIFAEIKKHEEAIEALKKELDLFN